ncbi:unnamed protein product [Trifolium pratense]|uniref:Uncharacterized protein n=1 Tax=Trifolium pratense TaxID=57577 RepID=A0ACB0KS30_TRIPR|nr:unnamed protein product [Trifolium pratense]
MKLQALRSQYEVLEMDKNESIAEYVSKVQGLVHTMKNCGEIITDRMIIEKVMRTLIPNYDHIIAAIQESGSFPTMQLEDLVGSLEARELVINKRKNAQEIVQAMQVETFKKNGGNKGKNHDKSKNFSQKHSKFDGKSESFKKGGGTSNSKKKDKTHIKCYNYEKYGHYASDYWYMKGKEKATDSEDDEAKLVQEGSSSGEVTFMAAVSEERLHLHLSQHLKNGFWIQVVT